MKEPYYLSLEQILLIHDQQVEQFGGLFGLRDISLLESAIMRPKTSFGGEDLYETLFSKAAALIHSLILNHPFIDGNKRTGMSAGVVFLIVNNFELDVPEEEFVSVAVDISKKKINIHEITTWLLEHSRKMASQVK